MTLAWSVFGMFIRKGFISTGVRFLLKRLQYYLYAVSFTVCGFVFNVGGFPSIVKENCWDPLGL